MPVTEALFAAGMAKLEQVFGTESDPEKIKARMKLYRDIIGAFMDDSEWHRAVVRVLATHKYPTFPVPALLLEVAIERRQQRAAEDASLAFSLVLQGTEHRLLHAGQSACACIRDRYDLALIRERYGNVVAEALIEAGGTGVLEGMRESDEPFVRKAFVEAYQERATARPREALPLAIRRMAAGDEQKREIVAPGANTEAEGPVSREAAAAWLEKIKGIVAAHAEPEPAA